MKIEDRINYYYDSFTSNDKYICKAVLNHKNDCISLSIDEFGRKYHVSTSALSRFAQKLSLPGYSELRASLRLHNENFPGRDHHVEFMTACYHQCIQDIENKDCSILFGRMKKASRMIIFGEGYAQGRVAREMKRIFLPTGKKLYDVYEYDTIDSLLRFIQSDDIVFIISVDGEEQDVIDFAKKLKMKGIYTVSFTRMKSNRLSHVCDENLYIQSAVLSVNEDIDYETTTPYFILIELLYVKYKMFCENEHLPEK